MKSVLFCAILLVACRSGWAQCCCDHCGCDNSCRKVCRVVCETVKVPKITYCCECEDFCVPGPSCRTKVCDECGHHKIIYTPTCGKVLTRKKLVKKEEVREKTVYKWVVENLCCDCCQRCAAADRAAAEGDPQLAARMSQLPEAPATLPVSFEQPLDAPAATPPDAETEDTPRKFDLRRVLDVFAGGR